ncbi:MAG: MoaD/ThiS family protein [Anaerolineae bacterium]|nr:MoaD/ThiS family protein [Anaerolineae bacterium]
MRVQIELLGLSRLVTGKREVSLDVEPGTTFRDIVRMLADQYPQMIGNVIRPDRVTLQEPNILNLNAKQMVQAAQMGHSPGENDRIILMSMSAGG